MAIQRDSITRYVAEGWRVIVPTRRAFVDGNPEFMARVTVLQRGDKEIVVYTTHDGQVIYSTPRAYSNS